jgi:hypothetical protein
MPKPNYDTTLARIAGSIIAAIADAGQGVGESDVRQAVWAARAIVAEIKRTEPREEPK